MTVMTRPEQDAELRVEQGAEPKTDPDATLPKVEFTQEVRFAVVMYGGVSLAIYINGVAQELLKLVRATAPAPGKGDDQPQRALRSDDELHSTERVYRKLGQMIARGETTLGPADVRPDSDIRTRFVVD